MPVINGVYTKDFPALGRAPIDTDIIPIAEVANQITYKTTLGEIFNAKVFGTTGRLSKFTSANTLGNSILNEIGNAIHLTNAGTSYASFGIINPGTPGEPGIDNDCFIGSTINNDFTIRVNNIEAARFDTALRFKINNIQNALYDTDKFLVSEDGVVKYRTGAEVLADIGGASAGSYVPYTGAISDVDLGNYALNAQYVIAVVEAGSSQSGVQGVANNGSGVRGVANNGSGIKGESTTGIGGNFVSGCSSTIGTLEVMNTSTGFLANFFSAGSVLRASISNEGNITASSLIKAGGTVSQFLKADGSVDNNNYLTANDLPSTLSLYATNVPADVTDYFKLVTTIDDPDYNTIAVDVPTGEITTTDQLIASLVSPVNLINGNPGVFNVTTTGNITRLSGSGEAEFFFRIYKRDSGGVETLVGTSGNTIPVINSGYSEFFATAIWNDGVFDVTDSIVLKYYANRIAGGSNPTYQFQFGGDQPVRTIVPIPTAVIPNIFLEELADVEDGVASNNDGIFFDSSVSLWKYKSVAEVLGYTPVSSTGTLNYIPKFSGANSLINSTIFEDATGVAIGVPFSDPSFLLYVNGGLKANGNSTINGDLTASKFIVPGGTSSQFLKADGSLDSNSYALASALGAYLPLTGGTLTGVLTLNSGVGSNPNFASTVNGLEITSDGSTASNRNIIFKIASTTALSIDNSTNVAIGYTTNPSLYKLDVNGTGRFVGDVSLYKSNTTDTILKVQNGTDFYASVFQLVSNNDGGAAYSSISLATNGGTTHWQIGGGGAATNTLPFYTGGVKRLEIASTGAATFSVASGIYTAVNITSPNTSVYYKLSPTGGDSYLLGAGVNATNDFSIYNSTRSAAYLTITGGASGGNVGIGTTTMNQFVNIKSQSTTQSLVNITTSDSNRTLNIGVLSSVGYVMMENAESLILGTSGSERMRITSGGNVLIGTTTDNGAKLQVNGNISVRLSTINASPYGQLDIQASGEAAINILGTSYSSIYFGDAANRIESAIVYDHSTNTLEFRRSGNVNALTLSPTGDANFSSLGTGTVTATAGTLSTVSDSYYKIDAGFINSALDKVMNLKPRYFYWNDKSGLPKDIKQLGFYAQEVNLALGEEAANTPKTKDIPWGISDRSVIAMLTKAIQELNEKIIQLENK